MPQLLKVSFMSSPKIVSGQSTGGFIKRRVGWLVSIAHNGSGIAAVGEF